MIITCPDCATRYDVDDERFSPDGRSVRCSSCGESWFVPAPELIDVKPLDDHNGARKATGDEEDGRNRSGNRGEGRIKVGLAEEKSESRRAPSRTAADVKPAYDDEDEDDSLFDSRSIQRGAGENRDYDDDEPRSRRKKYAEDRVIEERFDDEPAPKGWRKGRQFIVEDDEDDVERRPFFARRRKGNGDKDNADPKRDRESLRFGDEDDVEQASYDDAGEEGAIANIGIVATVTIGTSAMRKWRSTLSTPIGKISMMKASGSLALAGEFEPPVAALRRWRAWKMSAPLIRTPLMMNFLQLYVSRLGSWNGLSERLAVALKRGRKID